MFDHDVIPRPWESPGTAYKSAASYQEIATGLRPRNDRGNLKRVLLFEAGNHRPCSGTGYIWNTAYPTGKICAKIDTIRSLTYPKNTKSTRKFMQNARIFCFENGSLGISSIFSIRILSILTLSRKSKIWYVMHGVIWAYSAHDAYRSFPRVRGRPGGGKAVCLHRPVRLRRRVCVFSGGGGGDPVGGSPTNSKKRIKLKEL